MPRVQRWYPPLYVVSVVALSIQTLAGANGRLDHHSWLALLEIIAAIGLLFPRTRRVGLALLLAVFVLASIITMHSGRAPTYLFLYAASAVAAAQMGSSVIEVRDLRAGGH
jgi:uncharacterized membrane protein YphA (DoxX/SURF4 family)